MVGGSARDAYVTVGPGENRKVRRWNQNLGWSQNFENAEKIPEVAGHLILDPLDISQTSPICNLCNIDSYIILAGGLNNLFF